MTAFVLTRENLKSVKRSLRGFFPGAKSSHLSEAFAAAIGRRTHASLISDLNVSDPSDPEVVLVDEERFLARAAEIGLVITNDDIEFGIDPLFPNKDQGLIDTEPTSGWEIKYLTLRDRAWRNMLVAGVNAAIEQRLLSVLPADNRWAGAPQKEPFVFEFIFDTDVPGICSLFDIGHEEVSIHVALWPAERGVYFLPAWNAGFNAGDAFAAGYLERKTGSWLQSHTESLRCRRRHLKRIANAKYDPMGYGDRGRL